MIPLPQILAEMIMALGGALAVANVVALVRPRVGPGGEPVTVPRGRAFVQIGIGVVVFVWGLASFITRGGG